MKIKDLYIAYKEAQMAVDRAEMEGTEEEFDAALDSACEALDELVDKIVALANGRLSDFDARYMATNPNYSGRFEAIVMAQ